MDDSRERSIEECRQFAEQYQEQMNREDKLEQD